MSFKQMKVAELKEIAERDFAIDLEGISGKDNILAAIEESGVTYDQYLALHPELEPEDEEPEEIKEPAKRPKAANQVLVVMDRENPTYETRGYRFTREHPYVLVDEEDYEWIMENEIGFRQATPKQASEFYS